ncbi:MAG: Hpt domain-containing protein [Ruminococcus sp.]|nr:Hpt domain-containing protein [Ruminococcus sp.]
MTVKECYEQIQGDYEGVFARFRGDERIKKFAVKFLADGSFESLCNTLNAGEYEEAFRAAHTLKGVCQNLGFTGLFQVSDKITEELRNHPGSYTLSMLEEVREEYQKTFTAVQALKEEM